MVRSIASSVSFILGAALFFGCSDAAEMPATDSPSAEVASDIESSAVVVDMGAVKAAVVVEKSTAESESAFVATTAVRTLTATVVSIGTCGSARCT